MKKTLTLVLLVASFSLSAQTLKGSFMIGGNANISFDKNDYDDLGYTKSTSFGISPEVAYFFVNNFSAGVSLPYSRSSSKTITPAYPDFHSDGYSIGVAPIVRYYFPVKKFFIVGQGSYGWYYSKNTYDSLDPVTGAIDGTEEYTNKYRGFSLAAGPAFFLSPYSSIEILANYGNTKYDSFDQSNFYISVGFQIYIPKLSD
jgi:hypothetical protein